MKLICKTCYFNQAFNVYIYTEEGSGWNDWTKVDEQTKNIFGGVLRLTKHQFGDLEFYTYGLMMKNKDERPGHGGEWSSNPDTISKYFGIRLLDVGLDSCSVGMTYEQLFKLYNPNVYQKDEYSIIVLGLQSDKITPEYNMWYDENGKKIEMSKNPYDKVNYCLK